MRLNKWLAVAALVVAASTLSASKASAQYYQSGGVVVTNYGYNTAYVPSYTYGYPAYGYPAYGYSSYGYGYARPYYGSGVNVYSGRFGTGVGVYSGGFGFNYSNGPRYGGYNRGGFGGRRWR